MSKAKKPPQTVTSPNVQATSASRRPAAASSRAHITGPTKLTIFRMVLAVVFFILVLIPALPAHILSLITFVAGAISDLIDGKWARKYQKVTDLGAFLDPLADKMLINLAFLALVTMNIVPVWVFAIILVRDFAVDGMRMMAAREGVTIAASYYGKLKTVFQLTALIILLVSLVFNWFSLLAGFAQFLTIIGLIALYLALVLTVFSGVDYLVKGWKKVIH